MEAEPTESARFCVPAEDGNYVPICAVVPDSGSEAAFSRIRECSALVFDWSGTVSDDVRATHAAAVERGIVLGIPTEPDMITWMRNSSASPHTTSGFGIKETMELHLKCLRRVVREDNTLMPVPMEGVCDALREAKRRRCGVTFVVVSAHPQELVDEDVKRYKLGKVFEKGLVFGDCYDKATTLGMLSLCSTLPLKMDDIVYVGDSKSDVTAAKKAGCMTVAVLCGYHDRETLESVSPDAIFATTTDFVRWFCQSK